MKRTISLLALLSYLFSLNISPALANYSDEDTVQHSSGGGSSAGTQAAAGMLSYMVTRAIQKKGQAAKEGSSAPMAPPAVITVVEFPVDSTVASSAKAEVTVQKGESTVNISTPVEIHSAPQGDQTIKCCKLTSLTVSNIWQHAIKVTVSGGGTQTLQPGAQASFNGDLGECPRIKIQSEDVSQEGSNLVAEDVSLCCKNLRNGSFKSFFAIRVVRYNFVELDKDCGQSSTPDPSPPPHQPDETPGITTHPSPEPSPSPVPVPTTPGTTVRPSPSPTPGTTPGETPPPHSPPPETPPPPPVTDGGQECACCCHLIQTWSKETPIKHKFGSPLDGSARVPLGKEFPLVVTAVDMDALSVSCEQKGVECGGCPPCAGGGEGTLVGDGGVPISGGTTGGGGSSSSAGGGNSVMIATNTGGMCKKPCESCSSLKRLPLAAPLHFKWEILSGPGSLKTNPPYPHGHSAIVEGAAAVYAAPDHLPAGAARTVTIRVTIDDMPYLADLDDNPVVETITLNLIDRKEQVAVTALSPQLGYGSIPNAESECACQPVTSWSAGSGIAPEEQSTSSYNVCVGSYSVLSAPAKDSDTISMQCAGKKCSSPPVMFTLHDALKYEWKPSGGNTFGNLENAVFWAPSAPGNVTVQATVTDSTIQYPDSAVTLPAVNIKVGKITLDTVAPPTAGGPLELGENLAIAYKIEPSGFSFENVELQVYNKKGELVYRKDGLPRAGGGMLTAEWPKAKWNQEPHIGAYANPNNGPYEIVIAGTNPNCSSDSKKIDTHFVVHADIRDVKAGTAARASGLDMAMSMLKVVLIGPSSTKNFSTPDVRIANMAGLGAGSYGKTLTLDTNDLNRLEDGKWIVQIKDPYDNVGNLTDADPGTPTSDPYETEIELW